MAVSPVASLLGNPKYNSAADPLDTGARMPQQTLGQDDFLRILVAQMTSQDPLNPKADTDFVAQIAQFTALEQSKAMSTDMAMLRANSLLGRTVSLEDDEANVIVGVVRAVEMVEGTPQVIVGDGSYRLEHIKNIQQTPVSS